MAKGAPGGYPFGMTNVRAPAVLAVLKRAIAHRGLRYRELAEAIGLSESGLKKAMTAEDFSLDRLAAICDVIEVDVVDILSEASDPPGHDFEPDEQQIAALRERPDRLVFLWALVDTHGDVKAARDLLGVGVRDARRHLAALSRLGLLEMGDEVVHLRVSRRTEWKLPAELGRSVMAPLQDKLLANTREAIEGGEGALCELGLASTRCTPATAREMRTRMRALLTELQARANRERVLRAPSDLVALGAMTVIGPYTLRDAYDVHRRS